MTGKNGDINRVEGTGWWTSCPDCEVQYIIRAEPGSPTDMVEPMDSLEETNGTCMYCGQGLGDTWQQLP